MPNKVYKPTAYQTSQASQVNGESKIPRGTNKGLMQAYQFRDLAASEAMTLKDCVCQSLEDRIMRARALKDLNSVWYAASERIRIIKGKPMPGSLRPIAKPKKVRSVSNKPLETLPDTSSTAQYHSDTTPVRTEHAQDKSMLKESLVPEPGSGGPATPTPPIDGAPI